MSDYKHILLAVDFSEGGNYVAEKALSLAYKHKSKLSIIHVLDNIPMPDTNYGTVIDLNQDSAYDLLEEEKAKEKPVDVGNKVCPVTGDKINPKNNVTYEYQGKTYHFCCPMCVPEFRKNPEKYIEVINKEKAKH